jgi:hypothetical protein
VKYQLTGFCMRCNRKPCYQVLTLQSVFDRFPGEPGKVGEPLAGAVKVSLLLMDGSRAELNVCAACAEVLHPVDYPEMYQRILRSWKREVDIAPNEKKTAWWGSQFNNGILIELGRRALNG